MATKKKKSSPAIKKATPARGGEARKIEWRIPVGFPSYYVTNLVVQSSASEFSLSFFDVKTPFFIGTPDEIAKQRAETTSVPADCVARIVVTPARMREFVDVLNASIKIHQEKYKKESE